MARPLRLALVAALLLGSGAHWVALQSYAWAAMTLEGWRAAPLKTAFAEAVSGKSPCGVCLTVSEGLEREAAPEARASVPKADFIAGGRVLLPAAETPSFAVSRAEPTPDLALLPPPTPPPRALAAA